MPQISRDTDLILKCQPDDFCDLGAASLGDLRSEVEARDDNTEDSNINYDQVDWSYIHEVLNAK